MAFDTKKYGGYGTGALGDVANPTGQINSYANVTTYTANSITIGSPSTGVYEKFVVGTEIIVHVSATNGTSTDTTYLGKYMTCKITAVAGSVLTVDNDFTAIMPVTESDKYQIQVVTIAQFGSLTLSTGTVTPIAYNVSNKYGGIIAIKCKDTLTMSGGSINLVGKGIPVASAAYRPRTPQEINGTFDIDKYSGWENHITVRQFLLNVGDGAAFVMVKNFAQVGTVSRIGGTVAGAQFCRGARDSAGLTAGTTNIGGSTILLVADGMSGFDPSIISKVRITAGQGLGRCYIASNTKLRNDEGLYAYDVISNPYRLTRTLNIKNYGDGSLGDVVDPHVQMNNYARVTAISTDGKTITYSNKTTTGLAPIAVGSMVMFHVSKHTDSTDMSLLAKFILAKVLSDDGTSLILDTPITRVFDVSKLSKYSCQIISVAQFNTLTISTNYSATTAWNDTNKIGGICAIACKGTCNISTGQINVEGKGGGTAYERAGLAFIGNSQMADILPLGQGHGSVFLLAAKLNGNAASRIGATYDGAVFGGAGDSFPSDTPGYIGQSRVGVTTTGGGYGGGTPGGGYGSNGTRGMMGAHIFLISDTANISLSCLSTGGGQNYSSIYCAGAGYGGGGVDFGSDGGYNGGGGGLPNGGGGGSAGWAFIYCNNVKTEDTKGVVI